MQRDRPIIAIAFTPILFDWFMRVRYKALKQSNCLSGFLRRHGYDTPIYAFDRLPEEEDCRIYYTWQAFESDRRLYDSSYGINQMEFDLS